MMLPEYTVIIIGLTLKHEFNLLATVTMLNRRFAMRFLLCRESDISAIAFHPSSRMAVSSSYGGDFKVIWLIVSELFH